MSRTAAPKAYSTAAEGEGTPVTQPLHRVPLFRAAHGRTGDKGDRSNISVIAWHPELYPLLVEQITPEAVAAQFRHRAPGRVQRFLLPRLGAMNFVLDGVLDGGVNDALNLDAHGKALSFLLLDMRLEVPDALLHRLVGPPEG
ncbi:MULTISPECIES: hypothetical protein [unclassified Variovorax]|uniref:AtuA-related protein n=1 Tax=unclassified Variovorax TaxID=663243 RepID=UPI00076DD68D|nr:MULTISPECIES: hypothetical protein [unclassified Variovorax]KWT96714.1 hypothetical protein APY03_2147 [Variovorax sp. WDL1]PNG47299.1 hypothetical protein CHC06_07648 [Variovorax sp. B2]PNG48050.1 hypothetical protein CHC07_07220 [Variovorax sp. B4]VTV15188.1 hypothetical protein WDL1CHR_05623 [Variovorax sp. WDL1]